jgi:RNA polymerase sigma-70 factor (ECF subfamily)
MFGIGRDKWDKSEFERLLGGRIQVLYNIAYSYFKNQQVASDALQDSVLLAFKSIDRLKDKEKFDAWITTILVNRCREILRKNKKASYEELSDNVLSLDNALWKGNESDYSKVDTKLDVLNLLNKLNEKYREVIRLKYIGDYTLQEIATILDIPLGTVKSRLSTGIEKLRELMEVKNHVV